jgi:hypothetical protein
MLPMPPHFTELFSAGGGDVNASHRFSPDPQTEKDSKTRYRTIIYQARRKAINDGFYCG